MTRRLRFVGRGAELGAAEGVVAGLVVAVEAVGGLVVPGEASDDVSFFDGRFARSFVCFGFELTGAAYAGGVLSARFPTGAPASPSVERTVEAGSSARWRRVDVHDRPLTRARLRLSSRACRTTPIARAR